MASAHFAAVRTRGQRRSKRHGAGKRDEDSAGPGPGWRCRVYLSGEGGEYCGSTVTVLLIVRFLSPIEQGYYYTLLSLVALQMVFELGFSFVVQQLAAHECIHLELHGDGSVSGDRVAHARLASTLQLSVRWYTVAAVAMGLILAPIGEFFFARHGAPGAVHVAWKGPGCWL